MRTVAWGLLSEEKQQMIRKDWKENGTWGLHLHCPEAAMPKDGPSAGGAITIAILSQLAGVKIHNWIGMTGEVNLNGAITAIGGLQRKLIGAKRAGVKLVLIPQENFQTWKIYAKMTNHQKTTILKLFLLLELKAVKHAMVSMKNITLPKQLMSIHQLKMTLTKVAFKYKNLKK